MLSLQLKTISSQLAHKFDISFCCCLKWLPASSLSAADDIGERYDNLSKSVSDRNEKLQITLTRSMSVQDGLDEMMGWMEGVEASVEEKEQIPLDSASIGDILSKEAVGLLFHSLSIYCIVYCTVITLTVCKNVF